MPGTSPGYLASLGPGGASTGLLQNVKNGWDPTSALPAGPANGDRYYSLVTAGGWTLGHIYQWSAAGVVWVDQGLVADNSAILCTDTGNQMVKFTHPTLGASLALVSDGFSAQTVPAVDTHSTLVHGAGGSTGTVGVTDDPTNGRTGSLRFTIAVGGDVGGAATFTWAFQGGAPSLPQACLAVSVVTDGVSLNTIVNFTNDAGAPGNSFIVADTWDTDLQKQVPMSQSDTNIIGQFSLLTPSAGSEYGLRFGSGEPGFWSVVGPAPGTGYTTGMPAPGTFDVSASGIVGGGAACPKFVNPDGVNPLNGDVLIAFRKLEM
jgi:hypothetical protein